tara:strand:+ start:235 stop:585 length:351 start_codon:yes stop_codon:yes gene_type:complete
MTKSAFKLKSGNNMSGSSFKMMGSSPVKDEGDYTDPPDETKTTEELNVGSVGYTEGGTSESLHERRMRADAATKPSSNVKENLETTYPGTVWSKVKTKSNPRGVWMTDDGRLVKDM